MAIITQLKRKSILKQKTLSNSKLIMMKITRGDVGENGNLKRQ